MGARIHDATVVGFAYEKGKAFSLTFERKDKAWVQITLSGVGWFGLEAFSEIGINSLYAWKSDSIHSPNLRESELEGAWAVLLGMDPQHPRSKEP